MRAPIFWLLLAPACTPGFSASTDDTKGPPPTTSSTTDTPTTTTETTPTTTTTPTQTTPTVPQSCRQQRPVAGTVATLATCEYAPSTAGSLFMPTVEWAMTQEMVDPTTGAVVPAYTFTDFPDVASVYHAPLVRQITDDDRDGDVDGDDTPDIAVVMADANHDNTGGALRLISGDGSVVHDSVQWLSYTDGRGTFNYAPWHFSGVAAADLDNDGEVEIAALVVRETDGLCYPAIYEAARTAGGGASLSLEHVYGGANYNCGGHSPAIADLTGDGTLEVIYGRAVFRGSDLTQVWYGTGGRGWYGRDDYPAPEGYWNSGYHSFAVDMDDDGTDLEVVAGRTVYTSAGSTYCELGEYVAGVWTPAIDGYPAVADLVSFAGDGGGEPEIVVTGNEDVSVYHGDPRYDPNGLARCTLISRLPNDPNLDPAMSGLPAHPNCNTASKSFGGPATIDDFDGDGAREVAVAGACYYSVYRFDSRGDLERYAVYETRDWSSSSTGSTVFDFNDDGKAEIVFSDEDAVYVWSLDSSRGLDPWERLIPVMIDDQHKSWTIHEYPLVADVDGDGKAEILVSNSYLPDVPDRYGIYVLGAQDDDWVSARALWNQHAYWITNVEDDGDVGYCPANWAPRTTEDYNSFRTQAPGAFGALAADDLIGEIDACQLDCGDLTVWVQPANQGAYITASATTPIGLYGERASGARTLLADATVGSTVLPGELQDPVEFVIPVSDLTGYVRLVAVVDDPPLAGTQGGRNQECDEGNNEVVLDLSAYCGF